MWCRLRNSLKSSHLNQESNKGKALNKERARAEVGLRQNYKWGSGQRVEKDYLEGTENWAVKKCCF